MTNTNSSQKRVKVSQRNYYNNAYYKRSVNTLTKSLKIVLKSNLISKSQAQEKLNKIFSLIDKGKKKRVFHKNNAARKKKRLFAHFKNMIKNYHVKSFTKT